LIDRNTARPIAMHAAMLAAVTIPEFLIAHLGVTFAVVVTVGGLLVYGFRDTFHLSPRRAFAIGGVCFKEARRRHVLWVTLLAIAGVIVICQMQHPYDEQDAARETAKFCLFATGMVVVLTILILACTNLPREIDSRVIYTIVTKPTSRLEIVVGKLIGLACVSAAMLIIMGLFTAGYLQVRSWSLNRSIASKLASQAVDPAMAATLTHYQRSGLLTARTLAEPREMQIVAKEPTVGDGRQWLFGSDQSLQIPFGVTRQNLTPPDDPAADPTSSGLVILAYCGFEATPDLERHTRELATSPYGPAATHPTTVPAPEQPVVTISILDADLHNLVDTRSFQNGGAATLTDPTGAHPVAFYLPPEQAGFILNRMPDGGVIYGELTANTFGYLYSVHAHSIRLLVPPAHDRQAAHARELMPLADVSGDLGAQETFQNDNETDTLAALYRTQPGTFGYQLRGSADPWAPMAVFPFRDTRARAGSDGNVSFELKMGIERGSEDSQSATRVSIEVSNPQHTGTAYRTTVLPETNRTIFFSIPAERLGDGNFDVTLRCVSPGQYVGVSRLSLHLVTSEETYLWNLAKSLGILWLMTVMVSIVAIFCSTFVSWPIAVILTLVVLLGHWGVTQLGDTLSPGLGRQVMTDLFGGSAGSSSTTQSISKSIDALAKSVSMFSRVLPDISQFSAIDDLDRGVSLPLSRLTDALSVLGVFGLPLLVLSYVLLRNKEVAP
jgi:hypothetical protein